jgi:hypothetical protein
MELSKQLKELDYRYNTLNSEKTRQEKEYRMAQDNEYHRNQQSKL